MAENKVILEFVGDVSGLKPAIDTLSQLGDLSEEQVAAFKKANAEFSKATKEASNTEKSVSKLATSFKQVSGAVAGKAISEPLSQMAKATDNATQKTVKLTTQLRLLQDQLAKLEEGTAEFEKLAIEAAQLQDQIGDVNERVRVLASDTFKFDAAVDAIRGVTAAFSVAQGAAALFGNENEDLQKALLRVQGATALLTGVQEIANQVTGQGAAKLAILSAAQKVQTFVTTGATAAVNAFRVALLSIGVGAAIAALGLIVTYWEDIAEFIGISNKGLETQKKLQEKLNELQEKRKNDIESFNEEYKGTVGQAKLDLELAEKRGASEKELLQLKKFLNIAQQDEIKNRIRYSGLTGDALLLEQTRLKILQAELEGLNKSATARERNNEELIKSLNILVGNDFERKQSEVIKRAAEIYLQNFKLSNAKIGDDLQANLTKLEVPPLAIDIDLQKAVAKQKFLKEELATTITQALQTSFDAAFQILANSRQAQFDEENRLLDQRRERELANKNLTESQKASIEKKFEQQRAAIRQRQFQAEKQAAIAQAVINGALAVTNILATTPKSDFGAATFALLALNAIQTAAQVAIISSQKPPKFAKGGWIEGKPHSQGGTLIEAEHDEFVVKKSVARQNRSFLEAFNNTGNVAKALDLIGYMPTIRDNDMIVMENKTNIDYSKLGRAVAREMSKLPQSELQVNYRGLLASINSQQSLIEWQKRKYN